jgi:hypothetical protein
VRLKSWVKAQIGWLKRELQGRVETPLTPQCTSSYVAVFQFNLYSMVFSSILSQSCRTGITARSSIVHGKHLLKNSPSRVDTRPHSTLNPVTPVVSSLSHCPCVLCPSTNDNWICGNGRFCQFSMLTIE